MRQSNANQTLTTSSEGKRDHPHMGNLTSKAEPALPAPPPIPPLEPNFWDMYGPCRVSSLFHRVNLLEYPEINSVPMLSDRPGLAILETHIAQGIRVCVPIGFLLSPFWWHFHKKTIPFADRPLAKFHHYFYPSAGYATPIGVVGGTCNALWTGYQEFGPPSPDKAAERKLVRRAVALRGNRENDRWNRTSARLSTYGMITMALFWKSGHMLFRMTMGFGTGVALAAAISVSKFDAQMDLLF